MEHNIPEGVKEIKQMFTEQGQGVKGMHVVGGRWEPKKVGHSWAEASLRRDCIL